MQRHLATLLASIAVDRDDAEWSFATTESGLPYLIITLPPPGSPFGDPGMVIVEPSSSGDALIVGDSNIPIPEPFARLLRMTPADTFFGPPPTLPTTGRTRHGAEEAGEVLAR